MESGESFIVTLLDDRTPGVDHIGGKAASLFGLAQRDFNVPAFFVIAADAYRAAADGRVPAFLRESLRNAWLTLGGPAARYAVRSSGLAEDSPDFSYAGIFDTVLDVSGEDAIVAAIERCWASHRSATANAYRSRRGVTEDAAMAVVVQRMVRADWAGVSFSADPLTEALSVCVVNATTGLGEKLVSGEINPEQVRLDLASGRLLEHRLPPGAEPLPVPLRDQVWRETRRAGEVFGYPQDLEWAFENDTLYMLQSRPITTLAGVYHNRAIEPWSHNAAPDAADRVWTRAYADEVWAPPLTPLFYDIQNLTTVTGQQLANAGDKRPVPPDVFKYYRAAAYMDSSVLERLYATLPPVARRPALEQLIAPERRAALRNAPWNWRGTLARLWQFEVRKGRTFGLTRNHRFLAGAWPAFLGTAESLCDTDVAALSDSELEDFLGKVWQLAISVAPECEVAVLYYAHDIKLLLAGLLERWCAGGEQLYGEVSAGLDNSETVRETDSIWSLASALRAAGAQAVAAALPSNLASFRDRAAEFGVEHVMRDFDAFLRRHRHRGANYKDLIYPRWGDDPEMLWSHVRAFLSSDAPRPSVANAQGGSRRRASQRAILAAVRGPVAPFKRVALRALFRGNEIYAGLRDNHRFYYDHVWWLVRRVYQETGRRLHGSGRLAEASDVFFLARSEIAGLQSGTLEPTLAATRISVRRREWSQTRTSLPPRFLRQGYLGDQGDSSAAAGDANVLIGLAASPGQVRGRARIVLDVQELIRVVDGEILVARQTDPGWTPAFSRLAGLVLETGGVLSHGASLCREYGLPCVTAVDGATSRISDGDLIALNGSGGLIEILERTSA